MNIKKYNLLCLSLILFSVHACDLEDIIKSDPLADLIFNNKNWNRLSEYPKDSYLSLDNPTLLKIINNTINNEEFKIYIVGYGETKNSICVDRDLGVSVKPFFITALNVTKKLLLARFRFFIDEKNKASIYASSFYNQRDDVEIHAMLLASLEDFLKEKNVSSVKNLTARNETNAFFESKGYEGWDWKKLD